MLAPRPILSDSGLVDDDVLGILLRSFQDFSGVFQKPPKAFVSLKYVDDPNAHTYDSGSVGGGGMVSETSSYEASSGDGMDMLGMGMGTTLQ